MFYKFFTQVVWVRHRDIHLLTVNQLTYTSDERFNCVHSPDTNIWTLQVYLYISFIHKPYKMII